MSPECATIRQSNSAEEMIIFHLEMRFCSRISVKQVKVSCQCKSLVCYSGAGSLQYCCFSIFLFGGRVLKCSGLIRNSASEVRIQSSKNFDELNTSKNINTFSKRKIKAVDFVLVLLKDMLRHLKKWFDVLKTINPFFLKEALGKTGSHRKGESINTMLKRLKLHLPRYK